MHTELGKGDVIPPNENFATGEMTDNQARKEANAIKLKVQTHDAKALPGEKIAGKLWAKAMEQSNGLTLLSVSALKQKLKVARMPDTIRLDDQAAINALGVALRLLEKI